MSNQKIWMFGTALGGKGGVAAVLRQYFLAGFFENDCVRLVETHHDRSAWGRVLPFLAASLVFFPALLFGRVGLVHAHTSHGGSFWRKFMLCLPAFWAGVPVIVHLHSGYFREYFDRGGRARRFCIRFLFRRAFRVVTLTPEWENWVLEVQPIARTEVVLNSLAGPNAAQLRVPIAVEPNILFLGSIVEKKGIFDLVRAFAEVLKVLPASRLIVGGGGEIERFEAEVLTLGISNSVSFAGWVDAKQRDRLLGEAWVFALPSYHEGLPMAILEAMAQARAVLSCPVGGIAEAVETGVTGLLVQPGNQDELIEALLQLLGDKALVQRFGWAGREAFEAKFSNDASLPKLLSIYSQAGISELPVLKNYFAIDAHKVSS